MVPGSPARAKILDVRLRRRHVFWWERFVQRPFDDGTYFSSSRTPWKAKVGVSLTKSTMMNYCKVWVASRARQVAICFVYSMDAIQIYPTKKLGDAANADVTFIRFELILTANIPSHYRTKLSRFYLCLVSLLIARTNFSEFSDDGIIAKIVREIIRYCWRPFF